MIKFVRVDPESRRYERTILAEMQPLVGKPLDLDQVGARITELYGLGYFETLDYTVVEQGEGPDKEYGLEVRARRKSWGPNYVRFGLNLQTDFQGSNQYNAAAEFLMTEIDDLEAELLTQVQIGSDSKITSEFYQPLDALATWFAAPAARVEARDLPIYVNNLQVADFRDREVEADVDFGRNLGNWGEIRVGYHRINGQHLRALRRSGPGRSAVQQRRVLLQVQLRPARQRAFPARRHDIRYPVGRESHQPGRGCGLRPRVGRLADGELARAQHAACCGPRPA